jgi:hypothetical protein
MKEEEIKKYTWQEVSEMLSVHPECNSKDSCDYVDTWKCERCLRNKFHLKLEDHYKTKILKLEVR